MVAILILIGIAVLIVSGFLIYLGFDDDSTAKKVIGFVLLFIGLALIIGSIIFYYTSTESGKRAIKDFKSDTSGGITRTVEVYDQAGNLIKTYEGKLDVQNNGYGNKVLFDLDGKRTIIYNATVIVQEK